MPSPEDYSRAEVDRPLESLEDLNDYRPMPPNRSFTVRVRYHFKGRGKPREYPLDDDS